MHPGLRPSADRSVREVCQRYDAAVHRVNQQLCGSEQGGVWGKLCEQSHNVGGRSLDSKGYSPCQWFEFPLLSAKESRAKRRRNSGLFGQCPIDMTCGGRT